MGDACLELLDVGFLLLEPLGVEGIAAQAPSSATDAPLSLPPLFPIMHVLLRPFRPHNLPSSHKAYDNGDAGCKCH